MLRILPTRLPESVRSIAGVCVIDHLYGFDGVAEYFLQNRQVISVHGGGFSVFELGGVPDDGSEETAFRNLLERN